MIFKEVKCAKARKFSLAPPALVYILCSHYDLKPTEEMILKYPTINHLLHLSIRENDNKLLSNFINSQCLCNIKDTSTESCVC